MIFHPSFGMVRYFGFGEGLKKTPFIGVFSIAPVVGKQGLFL